MIRNLQSQLSKAQTDRKLIRIARPLERGWANGYVAAVDQRWLVILIVGEGITYWGYQAFRLRDIGTLTIPAPWSEFVEKALQKRKLRRPKPPKLDLSSTGALLQSANSRFPLVTIHQESINPGACHVGRVMKVSRNRLSLLEISPGAIWESEHCHYDLKDITRIDFGGPYEDALALVGGKPPKISGTCAGAR